MNYWHGAVLVIIAVIITQFMWGPLINSVSTAGIVQLTIMPQTERNIRDITDIVDGYRLSPLTPPGRMYDPTNASQSGARAIEIWQQVNQTGINAQIAVGNPNPNNESEVRAWVMAEISPDYWVALEPAGYLVCEANNICPTYNSRYYGGLLFDAPEEFRDYLLEGRS